MNINEMSQAEILGVLISYGEIHYPCEVGTVIVGKARWSYQPGSWFVEWQDVSRDIHEFAFDSQLDACKFAAEMLVSARAGNHPTECIISAQAEVAAKPYSTPGIPRILHPNAVES